MKKNLSLEDDGQRKTVDHKTLATAKLLQDILPYFLSVCVDYSMCFCIWGCLCVSSGQTSSRWKAKCCWLLMRQTMKRRRIHLFWYTDQWWLVFLPVLHFMKIKPISSLKHAWQSFLENTQKKAPHKQTNKQTKSQCIQRKTDGKKRQMAKYTNPHRRRKRITGVSSWSCAHTCASTCVCVCQRSGVCV